MQRLVSAVVLLPIVVGTIWWLPARGTLVLALVAAGLAASEYVALTARLGALVPSVPVVVATLAACFAAFSRGSGTVALLMLATVGFGLVALAARGPRDARWLGVATGLLAPLYLGLPLGALASLRDTEGPETVLLFLATLVASDVAQYYGGRTFGRHALAAGISPKKTVEGAVFGLTGAAIVMAVVGQWWLSGVTLGGRVMLGATLAGLGLAGDLFESMLKRAADVKDASGLIPGHGGVLDRVDSLVFAAPLYYLVMTLLRGE